MKTKAIITILAILILSGVNPVQSDIVWTEGHHEINDGDVYGEIVILNDATLDIFGGDIFRLAAYDTTITNWYDGEMDHLWVLNSSIINKYGGELAFLWISENSLVNLYGGDGNINRFSADQNGILNLYAYDVVYHTTEDGWLEGKFISDDHLFYIYEVDADDFLHINIIPEPITLLLLGLGSFIVINTRK